MQKMSVCLTLRDPASSIHLSRMTLKKRKLPAHLNAFVCLVYTVNSRLKQSGIPYQIFFCELSFAYQKYVRQLGLSLNKLIWFLCAISQDPNEKKELRINRCEYSVLFFYLIGLRNFSLLLFNKCRNSKYMFISL